MSGKEALRRLRAQGCEVVKVVGSHHKVRCGKCTTTVAVHGGRDLPKGTLGAIVRQVAECIGKEWVR